MTTATPLRVLITAGPTREFIDDVRYLSNRSSGRMGIELARAFAATGAQVTLVAGPCDVPLPDGETGITSTSVVSAQEMFEAVNARFPNCDMFVAAAAVGDYRPAERITGKLKKTDEPLRLELVPNPDILMLMGQRRRDDQFLVGFALEVQDADAHARGKLQRKKCDVVVLNTPANFGENAADLRLIGAEGEFDRLVSGDKAGLARSLCTVLLARRQGAPTT